MVTSQVITSELYWALFRELAVQGALKHPGPVASVLFLKYVDDNACLAREEGEARRYRGLIVPHGGAWSDIGSKRASSQLIRFAETFERENGASWADSLLTDLCLFELSGNTNLLELIIYAVGKFDLKGVDAAILGKSIAELPDRFFVHSTVPTWEEPTNRSVAELLVELVSPLGGAAIYDPACGSGQLLSAAFRHTSTEATASFVGIEQRIAAAAYTKLSLFCAGVDPSVSRVENTPEALRTNASLPKFDCVVTQTPMYHGVLDEMSEPSWRQVIPLMLRRRNYNGIAWRFVQHILSVLKDDGRAAVLVPSSALNSLGEIEVRRSLVESGSVEAVISLPKKVSSRSFVSFSALLLNNANTKKARSDITFVDASSCGDQIEDEALPEALAQRIVSAIKAKEPEIGFSTIATVSAVHEVDANLVPARYVNAESMSDFLSGAVEWEELGDIAELFAGKRHKQEVGGSKQPCIRVGDLMSTKIDPRDLELVEVGEDAKPYIFTSENDILIRGTRRDSSAHLVSEDIANALIDVNVWIIRLNQSYQGLARYLVEYLNSEQGRRAVTVEMQGPTFAELNESSLRHLRIPIPAQRIRGLLNNLNEATEVLLEHVHRARDIRRKLFRIKDPVELEARLQELSVEASTLVASAVRTDDLSFQIRNYFPYPLAYPFRTLQAQTQVMLRYQEQLRVAENLLAFLGSMGLALCGHAGAFAGTDSEMLSKQSLTGYWRSGISPGDWQSIGRHTGSVLRHLEGSDVTGDYASLWFKGSSKKESEFAQLCRRLVEIKNDHKHDRGPKTPLDYELASDRLQQLLEDCYSHVSVLVIHPLRLVQEQDSDWRTGDVRANTLAYIGDHPGMRQEQVTVPHPMPTGHLFVQAADHRWIPLYPFVSIHYCPSCNARETYFIDRYDGPGGRVILKSFERGHTHEDSAAQVVGDDLEHWMNRFIAGSA